MHTRINGNEITFQNVMELQSIIRHLKGIEKDLKSAPNYADDKYEAKLLKLLKGIAASEKNKERPMLQRVVKRNGVFEATDGYKMAFVDDDKYDEKIYTISKDGVLEEDKEFAYNSFPKCEKMYPKSAYNVITADLTGLDRVIKANKKNFSEAGKMRIAALEFKGNKMSLVCKHTESVFFTTDFYSLYGAEDIKIHFDMLNVLAVIELVKHVAGLKTVTIKYQSEVKAVCFEAEGIRSMVMPVLP